MAENQCFLTQEGRSGLNDLLRKVYPGKDPEREVNKSQIKRDTKVVRDTLNKIFNLPYQPVQKRCLEALFERLNAKLEERYRDQNCHKRGESQADYDYRIKQELKREQVPFRDSYCTDEIDSKARSQSRRRERSPQVLALSSIPVDFSRVPPQEQLARRLSRLNYTTGQAMFEASLNRLKPAGAFLLQVPDTKVQHWLVRRLAQKVLGFENGRKLEINVACLGGNFEALWAVLAGQLKLSTATAEATIASLSELCQGKTVIITLSRFQRLDVAMQQRLIREFWVPLVQQLRSQESDWRSRLVLFLIQDSKSLGESSMSPFEVISPQDSTRLELPVLLEPLVQITSPDIQGWFEQEGFELLSVQLGEQEAERLMQQQEFADWETHPWTTLENICNVFQTEISEIEHYWKLAG